MYFVEEKVRKKNGEEVKFTFIFYSKSPKKERNVHFTSRLFRRSNLSKK